MAQDLISNMNEQGVNKKVPFLFHNMNQTNQKKKWHSLVEIFS